MPTIPTTGAGRILGVQTAAETGTTHTFPSLSSLTKNSGNLLIAIVLLYDGNTANAEFSGWGGGFTEFADFSTTTTLSIGAAYKISTGSETGAFTVTSSGSGRAALILMSIEGAHASEIPAAGGYVTGTNAAANPGALNPAGWDVEDTLWIAVAGTGEDSTSGTFTGITAAPASYTNLFAQAAADDVVGSINAAVAFRNNTVASEDPGTFTNDITNIRWGALTIAVRPVATQTTSITPVTIPLTPVAITWSADAARTLSPAILTFTPVALTGTSEIFDPLDFQVDVVSTTASLTWDASLTDMVSRYSVFRRTPLTGADFDPGVDTPIASPVAALSYDDVGLGVGDYEWQVFGIVEFLGPSSVPGLICHLDGQNAGSIVASGSLVSQWSDLSGLGNHATQPVSSAQPTTGIRTQNSKNVLDFDGTADCFALPITSADRTQSLFFVAINDTADSTDSLIGPSSGNWGRDVNQRDGRLTVERVNVGTMAQHGGAVIGAGTARILSVIMSATDIQLGQNGVYETDVNSDDTSAGATTSILAFNLFAGGYWDGWIAEVIIYDRTVSNTNRDFIISYLNTKWAVF